MTENYGNSLRSELLYSLSRNYSQLEYSLGDPVDPLENSAKHFEWLVYPSVLEMVIDRMGPKFIEKLKDGDLEVAVTYEKMNQNSLTKDRIRDIANERPIKLTISEKTLIESDGWFKHTFDTVSGESMNVFRLKVMLAIMIVNESPGPVFNHLIMNAFVNERLKVLSMAKPDDILLIDHVMVNAII